MKKKNFSPIWILFIILGVIVGFLIGSLISSKTVGHAPGLQKKVTTTVEIPFFAEGGSGSTMPHPWMYGLIAPHNAVRMRDSQNQEPYPGVCREDPRLDLGDPTKFPGGDEVGYWVGAYDPDAVNNPNHLIQNITTEYSYNLGQTWIGKTTTHFSINGEYGGEDIPGFNSFCWWAKGPWPASNRIKWNQETDNYYGPRCWGNQANCNRVWLRFRACNRLNQCNTMLVKNWGLVY